MTLKSATVWRFERVYETLTRFLPPESLNTILSQLMTVIKLSLCSDIKLNLSLNQNSICSSGSLWSWGHLTLFRNDGEGLHHIFKELRESIPTVMRWRGRNTAWAGHLSITHPLFTQTLPRASSQDYVHVSGLWEGIGDPAEGSFPPMSMRLQEIYCLKKSIATQNSHIVLCLPDWEPAFQLRNSSHTPTLCVWLQVAANQMGALTCPSFVTFIKINQNQEEQMCTWDQESEDYGGVRGIWNTRIHTRMCQWHTEPWFRKKYALNDTLFVFHVHNGTCALHMNKKGL